MFWCSSMARSLLSRLSKKHNPRRVYDEAAAEFATGEFATARRPPGGFSAFLALARTSLAVLPCFACQADDLEGIVDGHVFHEAEMERRNYYMVGGENLHYAIYI